MDPGGDLPFDIGAPSDWTASTVSNLPSGARLGSLWVGCGGDVFVWSSRPQMIYAAEASPRRTDPGIPGDPGGPAGPSRISSTLHHWDGALWTVALELPGEQAASIYGTGCEVYAATVLASGGVRLRRFDGKRWKIEKLPEGIEGRAGALAGKSSDLYFRVGSSILRRHGSHWKRVFTNPNLDHDCGRTLVYLARDEVMAPCCHGQAVYDGHRWRWRFASGERDVHAAWGMRDAEGALHLFAAGSEPIHSGPRIWSFAERGAPLSGEFHLCSRDLHEGGCETVGYHAAIWGLEPHQVFAAGTFDGWGSVSRFDGETWRHVEALSGLPPCTGLAGNAHGVWIALSDGRLLHANLTAGEPVKAPKKHQRGGIHRALAAPPAGAGNRLRVLTPSGGGAPVLDLALAAESQVVITAFDVAGRAIGVLDASRRTAGVHRVTWTLRVPAGVYFCRVRAGEWSAVRRVVIRG